MRIVSLLPSATEIICSLGLRDCLVGVTHECDYPSGVDALPQVTRTLIPAEATSGQIDTLVRERLQSERALYTLDLDTLRSLEPDLIVTQALCDVCAVAEHEVMTAARSLSTAPRVINLEPSSLEDVFACLQQVGRAAEVEQRASEVIAALRQRVRTVADRSATITARPRVVLLEWIDPPFSSGHWSPELVRWAGGAEAIGDAGQRSATLRWDQILDADPEVLVIACCGFDIPRTMRDLPTLRSYPGWERLTCVRNDRVYVVDGSAYFSRPGPRLVDSLEILAHALHPELHPLPAGLPAAKAVPALSPKTS